MQYFQLSLALVSALLVVVVNASILPERHTNAAPDILVFRPWCQTMDQFEENFKKLCPIWIPPPTVSDGYYYSSTTFKKGDKDGSSDDWLARVNCLYVTLGNTINAGAAIAESLGGYAVVL
ncbi:uncharacterized protein I303_100059 [Kwoniella dejecticola CBS 10117]|uniref:Uncharacterized protein n=1 Tax=Kwoniella dejecticola CBS 10117 TaxID=1296121 RepID=A0A1A6ADY2_9TREE|nr:uncharacterized protein I303_00059 [Kwoniella dejecticola CBS 10117]OBR88248.1 hypothetical protein I303_00059 [Kwoniella dejecticola CBS 10117]